MPMSTDDTELDKYINDLADIKDDPDPGTAADDTVDDNDEPDAGDGAGSGQPNEQNVGADQQDQSADPNVGGQKQKDNGKKGQQPSKGKKATGQDELRPLGDGVFANSRGDIVDQSGKLIAQNGFAARMYQTNRRLRAQLDERTNELLRIQQQVGEVRALATSIQQYGLSNDEAAKALDMAGRMKRGDVLSVAKDILAIIAAQGYNVTDLLGSEVGDSLELRAVKQMLDERLAPITRQEQDRQQQEYAAEQGRRAYERFVAENEYADIHAGDIVQIMQREHVTPQVAYNRLMQFASINRLDFTKPLGPQVVARIQEQQRRQQQPNNRQQQKPMPNGAATRTSGAVPTMPLAGADDDWGTIISEVQRTLGNA